MPSKSHPSKLQDGTSGVLRTKLVCTIGPASHSKETLIRLAESGMNIARINLTHASHAFAAQVVKDIREYSASNEDAPQVGIWFDINGPKVRTGKLAGGKPVELKKGQEFFFVNEPGLVGDNTRISTSYTRPIVNVGDTIRVDDGNLSFEVVERLDNSIRTVVENSGVLGENKGINFPASILQDLPAISAKDKEDILFALDQEVDFLSVSCIRNAEDMEEVRLLVGNSKVKIIAKIENKNGMENFDSILKTTDGIVIDRGYLGAEVDVEVVCIAQKTMVSKANALGKPIMIANQMLESMKYAPRPTRSEAADVANAVIDGADGLVLSAETAVGEFVFETLETARKIAYQAEKSTNYLEFQQKAMRNINKPIHVNESIASSAVLLSRQVGAAVIVCITEAGGTARLVAKYRPLIPVVAATTVLSTARQLSLNFGLVPYYHKGNAEDVIEKTLKYAVDLGLCQPGDIAVVTSGQVIGFLEGTTTKMQVVTVPQPK